MEVLLSKNIIFLKEVKFLDNSEKIHVSTNHIRRCRFCCKINRSEVFWIEQIKKKPKKKIKKPKTPNPTVCKPTDIDKQTHIHTPHIHTLPHTTRTTNNHTTPSSVVTLINQNSIHLNYNICLWKVKFTMFSEENYRVMKNFQMILKVKIEQAAPGEYVGMFSLSVILLGSKINGVWKMKKTRKLRKKWKKVWPEWYLKFSCRRLNPIFELRS